jgi:Xaa-Pro aminopeptidase
MPFEQRTVAVKHVFWHGPETYQQTPLRSARLLGMPTTLMHADSLRDPDLYVATGVAIVDPFAYLEIGDRRILLTSTIEADAARRNSRATEVVVTDEFGMRDLVQGGMDWEQAEAEVVGRLLEREGVTAVSVPARFPLHTAEVLRARGVEVDVDAEIFRARRRTKDEAAMRGIRAAQVGTNAAFHRLRELLGASSPGPDGLVLDGELLTCERLRAEVMDTLRAHGCGGEQPIVASGRQNADVHVIGFGPVHPGEPIVADIFPQHLGSRYFADMTRTLCVGPAPDWLTHMHATVLEALKRSTELMRPGVAGRTVYDAACDVIEAAGFRTERNADPGVPLDEDFFHGLGHGVGVEVHELPHMGLSSPHVLEPGDVVTNEPGVYRKATGGVRLEDMLLITADGHEVLSDFDYELEVRP